MFEPSGGCVFKGPRLTRRLLIGGGLAAAGLPLLRTSAQPRRGPALTEFGGVGDGRTDNAAALRQAFAALGPSGMLTVPAGRFLVSDRSIHEGAPPFTVPRGFTVSGDGARSVLLFQRERFGAFYGLALRENDILVRDMALEVDTAGSGWTAAAAIVGATGNLRFANVRFAGTRVRSGHYGILPLGADLDGLTVSGCRFERLDFGFSRQTTDTSVHRGLSFVDCIGEDCTEVFEINSPGLAFVTTRAGSDIVEELVDETGRALDPGRLRVGQAVRGPLFAPGTVIAGRDPSGRLRMSNPAVRTAPPDRRGRLSVGAASGGTIRNLVVRNIGQWGVGLANADDWDVEVQGEGVGYELVHIEDGSRNIRVRAGGSRCNLLPGVVGSPGAENGMVGISSGSHDISVRLETADLTHNEGAHSPAGLCVLAGGMMGTTGMVVPPTGISVSGRVLLRTGTRGVVALEGALRFDGLELINPDPGSRADPMMRLPGCAISGTVRVHNPGATLIQEEPTRPVGSFDRIETI
jgi:hypothetical protein